MRVIFATDHAGFEMKEYIKKHLERKGYIFEDVGAHSFDADDDYPPYMKEAAERMRSVEGDRAFGIVFGGSGQGEAIVMNRFRGVRAIVYTAHNLEMIRIGREHNDANVLSIGARFVSNEQAAEAADVFLSTPFPEEERHARRIAQIDT